MSKYKIAITADTYRLSSEIINLVQAPFAARGLVEVVSELGGMPVILPDVAAARGEEYAETFDGLILPGGPDVDPTFFQEEPWYKLGRTNRRRDEFELEIFKAFYEAGKPILGICRGCQLINIALGGSVYQDLGTQRPETTIKHAQAASGELPTHHVAIAQASALFQTFGAAAFVNSRHHQGIKTVGKGLVVSATATDGVVEGIETQASDQIVAVQWHPENMWQEHAEMRQFFADFMARVGNKRNFAK